MFFMLNFGVIERANNNLYNGERIITKKANFDLVEWRPKK